MSDSEYAYQCLHGAKYRLENALGGEESEEDEAPTLHECIEAADLYVLRELDSAEYENVLNVAEMLDQAADLVMRAKYYLRCV